MSCVQLSGGGFPGGLPPWLVVPVIRSCQSPTWIWLVNHLHVHLHHDGCVILMANKKGDMLDKQMHQTMLQMCAAPICAAHRTSQVQILASVPGSCMWNA